MIETYKDAILLQHLDALYTDNSFEGHKADSNIIIMFQNLSTRLPNGNFRYFGLHRTNFIFKNTFVMEEL